MLRPVFLFFVFIIVSVKAFATVYYYTNNGHISFRSDAPQELISASSDALRGLIDTEKKTFVYKVILRTFKGFNSALQQEHFNEKFLESEKYPEAEFTGKIIEDINFNQPGKYTVRAKGKLTIHGVEQERIIKTVVTVRDNELLFESAFTILLADFNIKIPKVVHEKIASEISVEVKGELKLKSLDQ